MYIYILHSLKTKWIPIMEQMKIYLFSLQSSTVTPIMLNFIRSQAVQVNKSSNITSRKNWLYQAYMDIVQRGYFKAHLLFDLRRVNEKNPPSPIRSDTSSLHKQYCYYISQNNDRDYDIYAAEILNDKIKTFIIKSSVGKTNFSNKFTIKADKKLQNIKNSYYNIEEEKEENENTAANQTGKGSCKINNHGKYHANRRRAPWFR